MKIEMQEPPSRTEFSELLAADPRWQLVNRIASSTAFARAKQLREFLLYSSKWALTHPGEPLSEIEIAQNVMGRRGDFDSAHDNIVRVQASHLRRKLDVFFATDGIAEEIQVTLPKGSYAPVFEPAKSKLEKETPATSEISVATGVQATIAEVASPSRTEGSARLAWTLLALLAAICVGLTIWIFADLPRTSSQARPAPAILAPLLRNKKPVVIVLPDLGLSVVQNLMHKEVDVQEYASGKFPEAALQGIADPQTRDALNYIGTRRAVSYSEVNGLLELVKTLQQQGVTPTVRFARDIHVRDMGSDNTILIGSRRSNLWTSIFSNRTNFQFVQDAKLGDFYFLNKHPLNQERQRYVPTYTAHGGDAYVDVAVFANPTNSGYVLLIDGSDAEVNEAATRYLLETRLPRTLQDDLERTGLQMAEIFLKGAHLVNEADSQIEILAVR